MSRLSRAGARLMDLQSSGVTISTLLHDDWEGTQGLLGAGVLRPPSIQWLGGKSISQSFLVLPRFMKRSNAVGRLATLPDCGVLD